MNWEHITSWVAIVTLLTQFGVLIWWASRQTAIQQSMAEALREVRQDLKEHREEDWDFQLDVVEKLGSITPSIPRRRS